MSDMVLLRIQILISFFLAVLTTATVVAQTSHRDDDTLFFSIDDHVVITATRVPTKLQNAPAATEVLSSAQLRLLPVLDMGDVMKLTTGATVRDYGGGGSLQLVSLRGLGAEYTIVYLNGIRLNDAQNSTVNLSLLPMQAGDQIEIARGGFTALYGNSALGGVINLRSGSGSTPPTLSFGAGSFGWKTLKASVGEQGSAGRFLANVSYEESDNDYVFTPAKASSGAIQESSDQVTRQNAGYIRRGASLSGMTTFAASTFSAFGRWSGTDAGVPGAYTGSGQGKARQNDDQLYGTLSLKTQTSNDAILGIDGIFRSTIQTYSDPGYIIDGSPLESRYDNLHIGLNGRYEQSFSPNFQLNGGIELSRDELASEQVTGVPLRWTTSAWAAAEWNIGALRLYPSLRYDGLFDTPGDRDLRQLNPSLGLNFRLSDILSLRGRATRSFSSPTFNQLYWRQGGNLDLRPEFSYAFDAGFRWRAHETFVTVDLTGFHHDITDKILWMPGTGIYWTPVNIRHVISNGVELALNGSFAARSLWYKLSGSWISSRKVNSAFEGDKTTDKQLIYVPEWRGSAVLYGAALPWLTLSLTGQFVGTMYYTETNDRSIPAHAVADVAAVVDFKTAGVGFSAKLEFLNLFDTSYQAVAFYPMPGRHLRMTLTTHL